MTRNFYLILFFITIVMINGVAAAEPTNITAPSGAISNTTTLPFNVSGLSGSPGLEFELRYDNSVLSITSVVVAPAYRGSNVIPNVNNDAGIAKILMISTNGITAASPSPVILVTFTVKGTGYTPLQLQNAKWVTAGFNSIAFDTATSGLITTNGAIVPVAAVVTTLPPAPPQAIAPPVYPPANPTELPTLDLPTPSGTAAPITTVSPVITGTTTAPAPERTLVLFSPTETRTAATPAIPAAPPGTQAAQPAETQKSPGFSWPVALAASGLGAVAVLCSRRA